MILVPGHFLFPGNLTVFAEWFCAAICDNLICVLFGCIGHCLGQQHFFQSDTTVFFDYKQVFDNNILIDIAATHMGSKFVSTAHMNFIVIGDFILFHSNTSCRLASEDNIEDIKTAFFRLLCYIGE